MAAAGAMPGTRPRERPWSWPSESGSSSSRIWLAAAIASTGPKGSCPNRHSPRRASRSYCGLPFVAGLSTATASFDGKLTTIYGWPIHVGREIKPRSWMNFPMQANGAEMMRVAAIAATESGLEVCCPIHDAFLIAGPIELIDEHTGYAGDYGEGKSDDYRRSHGANRSQDYSVAPSIYGWTRRGDV